MVSCKYSNFSIIQILKKQNQMISQVNYVPPGTGVDSFLPVPLSLKRGLQKVLLVFIWYFVWCICKFANFVFVIYLLREICKRDIFIVFIFIE